MDPTGLTSSAFVPRWTLLTLRLLMLAYFAAAWVVICVVSGYASDGGLLLIYYTIWTFLL
jgi:hypothetical protein